MMKKTIIALLLFFSITGIVSAQVCNCNDPQNILDGDLQVLYFHRILALNIGTPNLAVEIYGNWYDNTGMPVSGPVNAMTNGAGMLNFEFFSPPGVAFNFDVHYNPGQGELSLSYMGVACDACMAVIPTMGQWASICLLFMMGIGGVLSFRQMGFGRTESRIC